MAQLIRNGTFARPFAGDVDYYRINGGNADRLEGWTMTTPLVGVDVYGTQVSRSHYQAVDLNGDDRNGISQDFSPTTGKRVRITWQACQNPHVGWCLHAPTQSYEAFVTDSGGAVVAKGGYTPLPTWSQAEPLTFLATGSAYTLTFSSQTNGWCGATITGVIADEIDDPPPPPPPSTDFQLRQPDPVQAAPGGSTTVNVEIAARSDAPVDKAVPQVFTAPTGFLFTGAASYGYYFGEPPHPVGNLTTVLGDGGRTITVSDPIAINTSPQTRHAVTYTFALQAKQGAVPGTYADGSAKVGSQSIPLIATVR
ncbi:hypothetical protein [Streptomyces rubellomurinus]|uniref:hypothetical protein n=1 Tax=Streptomyces rubellomurinus (strain ATCC 31215) TaxID=359131 RepID=UPI0006970ABF|nr:hypothetical protein [Streptomyces rubellomurinus]